MSRFYIVDDIGSKIIAKRIVSDLYDARRANEIIKSMAPSLYGVAERDKAFGEELNILRGCSAELVADIQNFLRGYTETPEENRGIVKLFKLTSELAAYTELHKELNIYQKAVRKLKRIARWEEAKDSPLSRLRERHPVLLTVSGLISLPIAVASAYASIKVHTTTSSLGFGAASAVLFVWAYNAAVSRPILEKVAERSVKSFKKMMRNAFEEAEEYDSEPAKIVPLPGLNIDRGTDPREH